MMRYGFIGGHGPGWIWMLCGMVFWFAVIVLGAFLIRWIIKSSQPRQAGVSAEEILKLRLAKGEITKEQYEELKGLIQK